MSDDENQWKWNEFVEIGNTIHKMRGQVRILEAKRALGYANQLIDNEFILNLPIKDQQLYDTLLFKIAYYLDGNTQVIQDAVEKYFLIQHCKAGLDESLFDIKFSPKKSGIQTGFICDIGDGTQTIRYYIKTHQYGPTEDHLKSMQPPDTKELFIYQLLNSIGMGPEVHFIITSYGTKKTVYIATKECHLTLLSQLTKDTTNTKALVQLDLISRILCLCDCATNPSNCGQVNGNPMIVDFRIEKQSNYFKSDILNKFYEGNCEFNYTGLMESAVKTPNMIKKEIMKNSLQEWNLLEIIDNTALEMDGWMKRWSGKLNFENDLQRYIQDIKTTVEVLMKA